MKNRFLVVDDEKSLRFTFQHFLTVAGYQVETASNYAEALNKVAENEFDVIIADILLGGETGIDLLRQLRSQGVLCPVIMVTGFPNIETASEAVRLGAFDYLTKPVVKETLCAAAEKALRYAAAQEQEMQHRENLETLFDSVHDGLVAVDSDGLIVECNEVARTLCGVSTKSTGKKFSEEVCRCSRGCHAVLTSVLEKGEEVVVSRQECLHGDRPTQVVTLAASPLRDKSGHQVGALLVIKAGKPRWNFAGELAPDARFHKLVGRSKPMLQLYALLQDLANVPTTALIVGESGTGKELVAESLHYMGNRSSQPLVKVNCAALPDSLLESELFGHVRGAFTGALKDRIGRLQMADGGTLFLDEIGDISANMQLRLLRVLQEKEFERVGSSVTVKVDVRIIAATNQDLATKVRRGEFREDLYYRLKIVPIDVPPLRTRKGDIPLLAQHFINRFNHQFSKEIVGADSAVLDLLQHYHWPGNVREFQHVFEHAFVRCHNREITLDCLPHELSSGQPAVTMKCEGEDQIGLIYAALEKTDYNKAKAARLLGIDRKTLYRRMEKYNIVLP